MKKAIILDLDDTILHTRSMDHKVFEPFFDHLAAGLEPYFTTPVIHCILNDLWQHTWDAVIKKYGIPMPVMRASVQFLDGLELKLNILPYPDYHFIKALHYPKFLVTTSVTSLQQAKIRALGIEGDFKKIVINDTFKQEKTKLDIFKELVAEFDLVPEQTFVIGDNAASEIEAGNRLHMVTIQVLREGVIKGDNARHYISSFAELNSIMTGS